MTGCDWLNQKMTEEYKTPLGIVITHWFFVTGAVAVVILLVLTGNGRAPEAGGSAPGVSSEARTVVTQAEGALSEAPQARR